MVLIAFAKAQAGAQQMRYRRSVDVSRRAYRRGAQQRRIGVAGAVMTGRCKRRAACAEVARRGRGGSG